MRADPVDRTVGRSDGQLNDVMSEEWCPTRWPG